MNQDERIAENRKKLEQKFGKVKRMGGKGSSRIVQKNQKKTTQGEDKNVKGLVTKLGAQPLPDIAQMNFFTEDDQVIQLKSPQVYGSFQNKTIICSGAEQKVPLNECFADVITEIPPSQLQKLKALNKIPEDADKTKNEEAKNQLKQF